MLALVHFSLLVIAIRISDIIRQEIHPSLHLRDICFFTQKDKVTADKMYFFGSQSFMIFHIYANHMIKSYIII